jgi:hypothetical protein
MSFVNDGALCGRDNRAAGSPAGRENQQAGVEIPVRKREANEYGTAVSTTLASAGTTCTGTATSHGFSVGNVIAVSGAVEAGYNGEQIVLTVADANTFTYRWYGSGASATGTITSKKCLSNMGD